MSFSFFLFFIFHQITREQLLSYTVSFVEAFIALDEAFLLDISEIFVFVIGDTLLGASCVSFLELHLHRKLLNTFLGLAEPLSIELHLDSVVFFRADFPILKK